ncbi:MoxR family ATPase [Dyadobacter sp. CY261]|uniref:AAA family ATPase n=1 Tax=Dyadobacter sp. CY261 TaxID=2907203 RepID=UPI001F17B361|nr:MoxR family ATPase [Dyadobacter sp. CY261]MCF0072925.1 MoxR family ATPase [Dyadobacter sp. CY261]
MTEKPYLGEALKVSQPDYDVHGNLTGKEIPPYRPSKNLIDAVRYARLLGRPLLIRGEPGCGKTKLAQAVAYELYGERYKNYFFEWYVKSTAKAVDGLYTFDHLARLRDLQGLSKTARVFKDKYLTLGPLGQAFKTDRPAIVLIDEIDKANIDFPNDLLLELDQRRFKVPEMNERGKTDFEIEAKHPPIVFITCNDERELPNAFLRRCVFHYITMSGAEWLEIVKAHFPEEEYNISDITLTTIVTYFDQLVSSMKNGNATKAPDTSELLDWVRTIHHFWLNDKGINDLNVEGNEANQRTVEDFLQRLSEAGLPYSEVLLKTKEDRQRYNGLSK